MLEATNHRDENMITPNKPRGDNLHYNSMMHRAHGSKEYTQCTVMKKRYPGSQHKLLTNSSDKSKEELEVASTLSQQESIAVETLLTLDQSALPDQVSPSITTTAIRSSPSNESGYEEDATTPYSYKSRSIMEDVRRRSILEPNNVVRPQPSKPLNFSQEQDGSRQCNCKMSKCLKLYCECFAALSYCHDFCRCLDCYNIAAMEEVRQEAIQGTKDRNNTAFVSKVSKKGHSNGCNCNKSQCLKKYCECFEGGVFCGPVCKCKSCNNFSGSKKLETVMKEMERKSLPAKEKKRKTAEAKISLRSKRLRPMAIAANNFDNMEDETYASDESSIDFQRTTSSNSRTSRYTSVEIEHDANSSYNYGKSINYNTREEVSSPGLVVVPYQSRTEILIKSELTDTKYSSPVHHRPNIPTFQPVQSSHSFTEKYSYYDRKALVDISDSPFAGEVLSSNATSETSPFTTTPPIGLTHTPIPIEVAHVQASPVPYPPKKRRLRKIRSDYHAIRFPFFGETLPSITKLTSLKILEHLGSEDLYSISTVSRLWDNAATDDTLLC